MKNEETKGRERKKKENWLEARGRQQKRKKKEESRRVRT